MLTTSPGEKPLTPSADRLDDAGGLETEAGRKGRGLDIGPLPQERFRAIEPERLDPDLHLAPPWRRDVDGLDAQHLGATMSVEANDARHEHIQNN